MGINVLSLFDGLSAGRIALERAGIEVDNYYSSEIDKYAIQIADKNYPQDIGNRLGDVCDVTCYDLPKIDVLIGGSPCQSFSFCGKQQGMVTEQDIEILTLEHYLFLKNDNFVFKGQSYLFWEYMRILTWIKKFNNPNVKFLLENVVMDKKWETILNKAIGVEPVKINSSVVSAQNRNRLYWSNLNINSEIEDKGLLLSDILDTQSNERIYEKPYYKDVDNKRYVGYVGNKPAQATKVYSVSEKSQCLLANSGGQGGKTGLYLTNEGVRKLNPVECERLQTIPEGYTEGVSATQRYKTLGNSWTVDVIAHIFKGLTE